MSNRLYSQSKKLKKWDIDAEEFDCEVENINKKFTVLGCVSFISFGINIYLLLKIHERI